MPSVSAGRQAAQHSMNWADSMAKKGLPGKEVLKGFLDGLRKRDTVLVRDWDK